MTIPAFLCYPGTLMYLCILVLLYVFTLVYKINQINLKLNISFIREQKHLPSRHVNFIVFMVEPIRHLWLGTLATNFATYIKATNCS